MTIEEGRDYTRHTDIITREELDAIIASVKRITGRDLDLEGDYEYGLWDDKHELILSLKDLGDGSFLCRNPQKLSGLRESIRKDDIRIFEALHAPVSGSLRDYLGDLEDHSGTPAVDIRTGREREDKDPK